MENKSKITMKEILNLLEKNYLVVEYNHDVDFSKIEIDHISYNSSDIKKNTLFICKGLKFKSEYLADAIRKSAIGYISEIKYITEYDNVAYIKVSEIKKAMAIVAAYFYDYAYKAFKLIGITGTKGKTTTTNYIKNILDEHEKTKTAYISTMHIYTGTTDEDNHLTTPESMDLHKYFYETRQNKLKYLTMEVASQGYKVHRVYGIKFDVGMFLNISEDHISPIEHPSFEDYLNCKLELLKNCKTAVVNYDTDYLASVLDASKSAERLVTFGKTSDADYYLANIIKEKDGYLFTVKSDKYEYEREFKTKLQGRFNLENALAAITVAKTFDIDDETIYKGVAKTEIPGRMTIIKKDNITAIVDYAHNFLSFQKLYETVKLDYPGNEIISIFGCPGNKAYSRRKDLGTLSAQNSNHIYLTADDPQDEQVKDICKDVATYVEINKGKYEIIEDREIAIKNAIEKASKSNKEVVIVIAGKGSETTQKVKGKLEFYPGDIELAKKYLNV